MSHLKLLPKLGHHLAWLTSLVFLTPALLGDQAAATASTPFEQAYAKWIAERHDPRNQTDTHAAGPFRYEGFHEIVSLGLPALPEIIERLPSDPLLREAVIAITKKRFPPEVMDMSNADEAAYIQKWWRTAAETTASGFSEEFGQWKQAKKDGVSEGAATARKHLRSLGTLALPHIFAKISEGETDLIPLASELVNGAIPSTATKTQCAEWWQQNGAQWTIHPTSNESSPK